VHERWKAQQGTTLLRQRQYMLRKEGPRLIRSRGKPASRQQLPLAPDHLGVELEHPTEGMKDGHWGASDLGPDGSHGGDAELAAPHACGPEDDRIGGLRCSNR
jgi:hypothetical protein